MGNGGLIPGAKYSGREFDHSHPFSAEVKNEWSYTPTRLHVVVLS